MFSPSSRSNICLCLGKMYMCGLGVLLCIVIGFLPVVITSGRCVAFNRTKQDTKNIKPIKECIFSLSNNSTKFVSNKSSAYNDSRIGTNFRFDDSFPLLIVNVSHYRDIQASIICARQYRVEINVMNGGHSFEGASCTNGILLHLDSFSQVISHKLHNPHSNEYSYIKIQSGMRLARLYGLVAQLNQNHTDHQKSSRHSNNQQTSSLHNGVYVLGAGTCPTVGVTGHVLCGGYGYLSRFLGMTSDQVTEFDLITSSGMHITANATTRSDLFYALRGGCSSAFGVVTAVTFKLTYLPQPNVTTIDIKIPSTVSNRVENGEIIGAKNISSVNTTQVAIDFAYWFQTWATLTVSNKCTATLNFERNNGLTFKCLCIGPLMDAIHHTFIDISTIMSPIYTPQEILSFYKEGSYFSSIVWFTNDNTLQTISDFFNVSSLGSISTRGSHSRRKTKSVLVVQKVSREAINEFFKARGDDLVNQIEWKAHGGVNMRKSVQNKMINGPIFSAIIAGGVGQQQSQQLFTDNRPPLLRGELFEMHYSQSHDKSHATFQDDAQLVRAVNGLSDKWAQYFKGDNRWNSSSYIGYIDRDLKCYELPINTTRVGNESTKCVAGVHYFGVENTLFLSKLVRKEDSCGVLSTDMSRYLF